MSAFLFEALDDFSVLASLMIPFPLVLVAFWLSYMLRNVKSIITTRQFSRTPPNETDFCDVSLAFQPMLLTLLIYDN